MKKNDLILIGISLLIIASLYIFNHLYNSGNESKYVAVYSGANLIEKIDLNSDFVKTYTSEFGENSIRIKDGHVDVVSASCKGNICVDSKPILKTGESIVCLPNRFHIEIIGEGEEELDAVAE